MLRTVLKILTLTVVLVPAACKPRAERSNVQDLNPGQPMSEDATALDKMKDGRKLVVVFYGNDTYATRISDPAQQNLTALTTLLRDGARDEPDAAMQRKLTGLADRLVNDWDGFRDIVSQNVDALTQKLCTRIGQGYRNSVAGFAVFRNFNNDATANGANDFSSQHVRRLKWEFCKPGDADPTPRTMEVPRIAEFPFLSQPFSHPLIFQKAMEAIRDNFDPRRHRFLLITKTHGSAENAISPHLSVDVREEVRTNGPAILAAIKSSHRIAVAGLDTAKAGDPILEEVDASLRRRPGNTEKGVSKKDYLSILNTLGSGATDRVMNFPIVLMESCKSDLKYATDGDIQWALTQYRGGTQGYAGFRMNNVGILYTSDDKGLKYDEINYWELLTNEFRYNSYDDFQDMFKVFLDSKTKR